MARYWGCHETHQRTCQKLGTGTVTQASQVAAAVLPSPKADQVLLPLVISLSPGPEKRSKLQGYTQQECSSEAQPGGRKVLPKSGD